MLFPSRLNYFRLNACGSRTARLSFGQIDAEADDVAQGGRDAVGTLYAPQVPAWIRFHARGP
jgi:hypothetical protein